ncbi:MAG: hypothetical protein R3C20_11390 [Planctomycetaceae bacterium]
MSAKPRSPFLAWALGILFAYNAWQFLTVGFYCAVSVFVIQRIELNETTSRELEASGRTVAEFQNINKNLIRFLIAHTAVRVFLLASVTGLFFWRRIAFVTLMLGTALIYVVNLWGGGSPLSESVDLLLFASVSVAVFWLRPIQWTHFE